MHGSEDRGSPSRSGQAGPPGRSLSSPVTYSAPGPSSETLARALGTLSTRVPETLDEHDAVGPLASPFLQGQPALSGREDGETCTAARAMSRTDSEIARSWSVAGPLKRLAEKLRSTTHSSTHSSTHSHTHQVTAEGEERDLEQPLLAAREREGFYTPTEKAVLLIQDAFDNQVRMQPRGTAVARFAHVLHLRIFYYVRVMAWVLMILSFFEKPVWCLRFSGEGRDGCNDPNYPTMNLPYAPWWLDVAVESVCLAFLLVDIILQVVYQGVKTYFNTQRQTIAAVLVGGACLDFVLYLSCPNWFRLGEFFRAGILINFSRRVRVEVRLLGRILPALTSICLTALLFLLLFAWAGTIIFDPDTAEGQAYFPNLGEAMWSLLILTTSANFPDVMLPAYEINRAACIFFISFLVLSLFLFMSMVLAIIYQEYSSAHTAQVARAEAKRQQNLSKAFTILDRERKGFLTRGQFSELVREMQGFRRLGGHLNEEGAALLFTLADRRRDNIIHAHEFRDLCWLLKLRIERVDDRPVPLAWMFPAWGKTENFKQFQRAIAGQLFDVVVTCVILVNAGTLLIEDWNRLWGGPQLAPQGVYIAMDTLFNVFYIAEILLKVGVLGWKRYWRRFKNKFDFVVSVLATGTSLLIWLPAEVTHDWHLLAHVAIFRLFRLMRLLRILNLPSRITTSVRGMVAMPAFAPVGQTLRLVVPRALSLVTTLFCLMVCYAALGIALFGGLINTDPNGPQYEILQKTPFGDLKYYPNSMNDLGSALVTLFELLVVNNWWVIASGYVAVTSTAARLYFIGWYFLGVVVLVNIVVALILDTFMHGYARAVKLAELQKRAADAGELTSRQSVLEGGARVFDASRLGITRRDSAIQGKFRAVIPGLEADAEKDLRLIRLLHSFGSPTPVDDTSYLSRSISEMI